MSGFGDYTAIVLAGGLGTRLRDITRDRCPKPMVPVDLKTAQYPFLEFALEPLRRQGIEYFVLCIDHLGHQVRDHFGDGKDFGINIRYDEVADADTGARVYSAMSLTRGQDALVVCGDVYHPIDVRRFMQRFRERPDWQVLIAATDKPGSGAMNMVLHPDGQVLAHGRTTGCDGQAALETGILAIRPSAFDGKNVCPEFSLTRDLFPDLARNGRLGGMIQDAPFFDVGTPERYRRFCSFAQAGGAWPLTENES